MLKNNKSSVNVYMFQRSIVCITTLLYQKVLRFI